MELEYTYTDLSPEFSQPAEPIQPESPQVLVWNEALAKELGFVGKPWEDEANQAAYFSGQKTIPGARPAALAYAGHQFGNFVPSLGDGRAHFLGELLLQDGSRVDLQLKGSGPTPFSRGGDGLCPMGPALREYLMSEALYWLNVPTTRTLAVVATGNQVHRQATLPGAVVTRVASSHIRVGTFEYFAARKDHKSLKELRDYTLSRHFPEHDGEETQRTAQLLGAVVDAQIELIVHWLRIGFIHGVMNTDNCSISGQTIDFGPCAMMNSYDPDTVFSSIDRNARYAFGNQPGIGYWNLSVLAQVLLSLGEGFQGSILKQIQPVLDGFKAKFEQQYYAMLAGKLGFEEGQEIEVEFLQELLHLMYQNKLDYINTYRALRAVLLGEGKAPGVLDDYVQRWRKRLEDGGVAEAEAASRMSQVNPAVIPRNHHVEAALSAAQNGDMEPFFKMLQVLKTPYLESTAAKAYQDSPADGGRDYQTFCGT